MNTRLLILGTSCVAVAFAESRLTNLSVRSSAGSGSETLIVGFAVSGSGPKRVLLRGIGPSLAAFNVTDAVVDPQLWLFSGSTQIDQNNDWGGTATLSTASNAVGAFALPANSSDAALLESLQPGTYSAQLIATSGPGVGLIECYDTENGAGTAYFSNVSAFSKAGSGSNVLTVGFAISGTTPKAVLIRGIGPTLDAFNIPGVLTAARLRLFDSTNTEIGDNTGWSSAVTPAAVFNSVGAFSLPAGSSDAVFFLGLPAGTYTAQLSGRNNSTGAALIEVYEVSNPSTAFVTMQPVTNAAAGPPSDAGAGTLSAGPDTQPIPITQARPAYPFDLRFASVSGQALVDFYVKSDGKVANAVAIRATDSRFAASATSAVQLWTFVPARRNGVLVTTHLQVPIIYTLDN